jgi:hypothetical protein
MQHRFCLPIVAGALCLVAGCATSPTVSTRSLLAEMTDLDGLAEYPRPAFTCRQFSSYDRAARSPDEDWFANNDCGQFLRIEEVNGRQEHVLMDAAGPGAIVRIWSANPQGTLRIYIDHEPEPRLTAPLKDLLGGEVPGVPEPIAGQRSRGWNCYLPIPYAAHCKVTCDQGGFYYHVNYRTYPAGTPVESFTVAQLDGLRTPIQAVAQQLDRACVCDGVPQPWLADADAAALTTAARGQFGWRARYRQRVLTLAPSQQIDLSNLLRPGPAAIVGLRAHVEAPDVSAALRQLVLTAEFDGAQTVLCPLGDFFGAAPGLNPYGSLPTGVTKDGGLWCRWVMPYRDAARLAVKNLGQQPVDLRVGAVTAPHRWSDRSMHFHAQWRVAHDVPTRPFRDWNYVDIEGRGVFVGAAFAITNPVKIWWGEGDEKIYVDDEPFPSHFGTGTEDYFGYAWCCNEMFTHAYHNQPRCDGPGNYGHTAVNRWHILDRIPFTTRFKFDMELWHWTPDIELPQISATTYWYARPGASSNRPPVAAADLKVVQLPPYVPHRVAGVLEGEDLPVVELTSGEAVVQDIMACSNEAHRWWYGAAPGDHLTVTFPVPDAGKYRVLFRGVIARDYGIVQLHVNGTPAGGPVDGYHDSVTVSEEIDLGEFVLSKGDQQLRIEIVGTNPNAIAKHMFGLDYVRLVPVDAGE